MAVDVEGALSGFASTLGDSSVDDKAKLKVLRTLSEVTLTLSELSNSGVGRAVRLLKSEPGELGQIARNLVIKWKSLLVEHMKRENIQLPELMKKNPPPSNLKSCKRPLFEPSVQSIDSSSGLSFEEAMSITTSVKKKAKKHRLNDTSEKKAPDYKNPSRSFTEQIIHSLSIPVDRPDVQEKPVVSARSATASNDFEHDGDLKFHSKKVIYAPRVRRSVEDGTASSTGNAVMGRPNEPPTLVNACLAVLAKHISMVDHVGNVPYELFSQALIDASPEDLLRFEKYNPTFHGLTGDLWKKHVHRYFPNALNGSGPRSKETWAGMYKRLVVEASCRLDQFINRSTSKLLAEKQSLRKTLLTDVITPAQVRRQATRLIGRGKESSSHRRAASSLSTKDNEVKISFKPQNMSYPTPPPCFNVANPVASTSSLGSGGNPSSTNRPTGSMLQKLRKQFLKGR